MSTNMDYYERLGVARTADAAVIKSAYRKLAMAHHPDKNSGCAKSEAVFVALSQAYECLKDPQKRAAYDRYGHAAYENQAGGGGAPQDFNAFSDIFEEFFGGFGGGRRGGSGGRRGADLRYDLEITLEDAFHGVEREIEIEVAAPCGVCDGSGAKPGTSAATCRTCQGHGQVRAQQGFFVVERTCPTCHGAGRVIAEPCARCRGEGRVDEATTLNVTIPPGVDHGTRIRLSGKGEAGARGAPAGDLYIFIALSRHQVFQRQGTTLLAQVPISFATAALGGSIDLPGLDGEVHEIRIPVGVQSGQQISRRGAGMPVLQGRGTGDLVVELVVETPTKLTIRQKELLAEFRESETEKQCPQSHGFFGKLKGLWAQAAE